MKKLVLIILTGLIALPSIASEISGSMECTVKYNKVVEVEDGITTGYSGYTDAAGVGDNLKLTYNWTDNNDLTFDLRRSNERAFFVAGLSLDENMTDLNLDFKKYIKLENPSQKIYINPDSITLHNPFGKLSLKRYFKNDWMGLGFHLGVGGLGLHSYTLDCRNNNDKLDVIIKSIRSLTSS